MTEDRLKQYQYLIKEIQTQEQDLQMLQASAEKMTPSLSGMPHGTGVFDRIGDFASELADLDLTIREGLRQCILERTEIERFVTQKVRNYEMRIIFRMMYIEGRPLIDIANELDYSVKQVAGMYKRYVAKNKYMFEE